MKVYHGSTFIVKQPNIEMLTHRTDFGKGFYTTSNYEQAEKWAKRKKDRLNEKTNMYVNSYEYIENESLSILNFNEATEKWLQFVFLNRYSDVLVDQISFHTKRALESLKYIETIEIKEND